MDIPSTRTKTTYWQQQQQQNINPTTKSSIKLNVDPQGTSNYNGNMSYYGDNNQLKRGLSISDQSGSPFKKRQFVQHVIPSTQTDEDDDDDDDDEGELNSRNISLKSTNGIKREDNNRRRAAHTASEQKRRNAIRKGYDALQSLVPNSHLLDPISSQKVSKAAILKRSTDYLIELNKEKQQLHNQLETKKNETFCLRTLQKTYEDILEMNLNSSKNSTASIDDEQKFQVFKDISDALFMSFDQAMQTGQVTNFTQFTSTVLRWIEDSCRPSDMNELIRRTITDSSS